MVPVLVEIVINIFQFFWKKKSECSNLFRFGVRFFSLLKSFQFCPLFRTSLYYPRGRTWFLPYQFRAQMALKRALLVTRDKIMIWPITKGVKKKYCYFCTIRVFAYYSHCRNFVFVFQTVPLAWYLHRIRVKYVG